jgi:peptidoglycan/xylan/chitin deacetylase (PgdA/CDA1 family)
LPLWTHRPSARLAASLLATALLLAACGGEDRSAGPDPEPAGADGTDATDATDGDGEAADGGEDAEVAEQPDEPEQPAVDPAEVGANELGQIPVLMYHRILPDGGGDYDNTPEEFAGELRRLHEAGYVPITTADLVDGRIDVPAGTTPVVLTFDDSTREQFDLDDDGEVVADTAVGIMLELADELDGFEPAGSFYVLESLFGSSPERGRDLLAELADLGFEVGNHSATHENLRNLDAAGVQRSLAGGVANIAEALPGYEVRTLSYPFGIRPEDPELAIAGEHDGVSYQHDAGLLVGSGPSPSPHDVEFDPMAVPRIRSQPDWSAGDEPDYASGFWLTWFEDNPERRYVSDGDPETISFPEGEEDRLAPGLEDRANPY